MATLLSSNGDDLIVVVKDCESAFKSSGLKISSQSVSSESNSHYRIQCYVDGTFDLNGAVQVYTQTEFDAEFGRGEFSWGDVDGGELGLIFGLGMFMASSVYLMAWGCRKIMDIVSL